MRVLLKKDNLYLKYTWIKRLPNGSLIGWNLNNEDFIKNFPLEAKSFEVHYHYPMKGKFHFSYKYKIEDVKYEIRAYKDHLNTKIWGDIDEVRRRHLLLPDFKKFVELFLIDKSDEVNLEDPDLVKQIGGVGFNIWTDRVLDNVKAFGSTIKPKSTDIVLDIDRLGKVSISCTTLIYNNPQNISLKSFDKLNHYRISNYEKFPSIELIVVITPSDYNRNEIISSLIT